MSLLERLYPEHIRARLHELQGDVRPPIPHQVRPSPASAFFHVSVLLFRRSSSRMLGGPTSDFKSAQFWDLHGHNLLQSESQ